jgi:membrane-associated phospholipid phosphatase
MSTYDDDLILRSRPVGLRRSSAGFIALLTLALVWPAPVVWLNEATFNISIDVDERSFLGREAPAWDVVFWGIAGVFALGLLHGRIQQARSSLRSLGPPLRNVVPNAAAQLRALNWRHLLLIVAALAAVAAVWIFLDAALIAWAELVSDEGLRDMVRLSNRLGGGMNPTMIIIFFGFAGVIFAHHRWVLFAVAMTLAGLSGGLLVNALKITVSRSRPELWLGPFEHAGPLASSFPSGHTVSAFAIAAVLLFGSRSLPLRIIATLLATGVAVSRVLSFRHWPSDVLASALIGLLVGWFFVRSIQIQRDETA